MNPYQQQPYQPPRPAFSMRPAQRPNIWLRLTSPSADRPPRSVEERERLRRARLASYIILSILVVVVLLIPLGLGDPVGTLLPVLGAGVFTLGAALFKGCSLADTRRRKTVCDAPGPSSNR